MKLGFLTAALPGSTLEQAAKWGAESGFRGDRNCLLAARKSSPPLCRRDTYRCQPIWIKSKAAKNPKPC